MCNENSWACLWHWQGISLLFKRPVQSVIPERVPDSLRQTSTYCIQPHKNTSQSPLHLFWSKMGSTQDHFVPLVSRTAMQLQTPFFIIFFFLTPYKPKWNLAFLQLSEGKFSFISFTVNYTATIRAFYITVLSIRPGTCLSSGWSAPCCKSPATAKPPTSNKHTYLRRFPLNVRAVSAKIKLPKKYLQHCHILRTDKKNLSLLLLPSWPRERKLDLKLSIFQLKRRFMSVQNKMAPVFSILFTRFEINFLENAWEFHRGVTWASELEWDVSNRI